MSKIFDGKGFAQKKEQKLKKEVSRLRQRGITPKLVSILIGNDPASVLYVNLKKKAAERIGAKIQVIDLGQGTGIQEIIRTIQQFNNDNSVHGIMVQLPLPKEIVNNKLQILNSIAPEKDVDGLRVDSLFIPATVKAILAILDEATRLRGTSARRGKVCVVGAKGMVGKPLVRELTAQNYDVFGIDLTANYQLPATNTCDVLISATGVPGIIKGDMVKDGAIVIDVGSPKGDVNFEEVSKKAAFITLVPGGVGPVTIVSLLENLVSTVV